jgi:hypothetical protein
VFVLVNEMDLLDKQQNAAFKSCITDKTKRTERKFKTPMFVNQNLNVAATTNRPHDDILKIGAQSRRYLMLLAKCHLKHCDRTYFNKFVKWLHGDANGKLSGYKALFYCLSKMDITDFEPRDVPCTKMLLQHKLANMDDVHSCFYEWMARNQILLRNSDHNIDCKWEDGGAGPLTIKEYDLFIAYQGWSTACRRRPNNIYRFLMKLKMVVNIKQIVWNETTFVQPSFRDGPDAVPQPPCSKEVQYLQFPPIKECMAQFAQLYTNIDLQMFFEQAADDADWTHAPYDKFHVMDDGVLMLPVLHIPPTTTDEAPFDPYHAPLFADGSPSTSDEEEEVNGVMSNLPLDSPIQNLLGDE